MENWAIVNALATSLVLMSKLSPTMQRAVIFWVRGEDTETSAQKAGLTKEEFDELKRLLNGITPLTKQSMKILYADCGSCGEPCLQNDKYCQFCGNKNNLFDESIFLQDEGGTFSESVNEQCNKNHPERLAKFCYLCGEKLY